MDFSTFKTHDWLMAAGGLLMIIALFADWSKLGPISGDSPFDYFFTGGISWLIVVVLAVIAVLRASGRMSDNRPWSMIMALGGALTAVLMLLRVIIGGRSELGIDLDRGTGMWLGFIAAIVFAAGAMIGFTASGGNIKDLTDPNKIKGAFDSDES